MSVELSFEAPDLVVVRCHGTLQRVDVDAAKRQVFAHMQANGKVHVLILLDENFANLQAFVSWDDIDEDHYIQQHVVRLAVVGQMRWRDNAILFLLGGLVPFQIEYFPHEQEEFARAWLLS